jgi:hypothetical protein
MGTVDALKYLDMASFVMKGVYIVRSIRILCSGWLSRLISKFDQQMNYCIFHPLIFNCLLVIRYFPAELLKLKIHF